MIRKLKSKATEKQVSFTVQVKANQKKKGCVTTSANLAFVVKRATFEKSLGFTWHRKKTMFKFLKKIC
jgi:hypothetical protein